MIRANKKVKVVVAMSGGVDSSVAAALLKKQGFDVIGIMMKFWRSPELTEGKVGENRCCSVESEKLARLVAKKIGIPFYVLNVEKEFKKAVVDYFLAEYKKGNTPNPCVVCNKEIKFGFLIKKALSLGADFVATGHYVRASLGGKLFSGIEVPLLPSASRPRPAKSLSPRSQIKLLKGRDKKKDQSYFLWQLNQSQLKHILFPVGGYTKPEVRKLAKKFKLPTADARESQEVCFVQNTTNSFLKKYLKTKPGQIVDTTGKVLGEHNGLWFYTIGQRRGLEIEQGPWYVVGKNIKKNVLIISRNKKDLLKKEFVARNVNWISSQKLSRQSRGSSMATPSGPISVEVKIRYKSNPAKAKIFPYNPHHILDGRLKCDADIFDDDNIKSEKVRIVFEKPQPAITPGQSAVFYAGAEILGGGTIDINW